MFSEESHYFRLSKDCSSTILLNVSNKCFRFQVTDLSWFFSLNFFKHEHLRWEFKLEHDQ